MAKKKAGKKITMRPKKARAKQDGIACKAELKKVGVGDKTVSIGFKFRLSELGKTPEAGLLLAFATLVNARLDVVIELDKEQTKLFPEFDARVSSVADCSSISVTGETVGGTLSFRRDETDVDALTSFPNKEATLTLSRIGDRQEDDEADADGASAADPAGGDSQGNA